MNLLLFIGIALGYTLIPGPNAMLIITTSIAYGTKRGLQIAAGISCAIAVHLLFAIYSSRFLVNTLRVNLQWFKWVGAAVIAVLVLKMLIQLKRKQERPVLSGVKSFSQGVGLGLGNPKALIFYTAFILPFVKAEKSFQDQISLLAFIFWITVCLCDISFAVFSVKIKKLLVRYHLSKD
ncbi:Leucine efflux protein [Thalassocella blandensis]|nr:Leucine efflux protein [Thalassocella blandensis]